VGAFTVSTEKLYTTVIDNFDKLLSVVIIFYVICKAMYTKLTET